LVRTAAITGSLYFVFEHILVTRGALIYLVSWLTYYVLVLFGNHVSIESGFPMEYGDGLTITSNYDIHSGIGGIPPISIVFACTAALALSLFTAAVIATKTDRSEWEGWARKEIKRTRGSDNLRDRFRRNGIINTYRMSDKRRKAYALLTVIPIIFVTNIFRNVGIVSAVYSDLVPFELAHNYLAKALSLGMMMFLTWLLFEYLPELQENLMGLFDLFKRDRKGMIVDGRLDMKYVRGGEPSDE
jgi:exosortase/archaeosortase family protein